MKRLLSFVMVACVVLAPCAYADSILNINISYVTATLGPNGGVYFTLIGPGTNINSQTPASTAFPGALVPSPT